MKKIYPGCLLKDVPFLTGRDTFFKQFPPRVLNAVSWLGLLLFFIQLPLTAQLPDEFQKVELVTGLTNSTTMQFAPDGRIFILDRYGEVNIYKPDLLTTVSAGTIPVFHELEDGLLGIAFDPDFTTNNYIYLYYSPESFTGNRISRFTMNGDVLDLESEAILLQWATSRTAKYHSGGDMSFDSQGNLYIATGDNATYPDLYTSISETNEDNSAEKSSSNTNDLRGKILRITPLANGTYTIPGGNLFPVGTINTRPEIYVMGARNPYRIFVDKDNTDWLFWGEVGPDASLAMAGERGPEGLDEINLTKAAGNYGWPYFSGEDNDPYQILYAPGPQPYYHDPASPQNISTWNTGATDLPPAQPAWIEIFHKSHFAGPRYYYDNDPGLTDQQRLPIEFDGVFFYYDFNTSKIWAVQMDTDGNITDNQQLAPAVFPGTGNSKDGYIDMKIGPDGHMYILMYGTGCCDSNNEGSGKLVRVDYTGIDTNAPPNVVATATPTNGALSLEVVFSSEGTYDPNGDAPLTYEWDFDGDGVVDSTDPNPTYTYEVEGTFNAQLRVDDGNGGIGVKNITIYAGNTATDFTFNSPPDGGLMGWGDDISLEVSANDDEDGPIDCGDINVVPAAGHENHFHDGATIDGCLKTFTLEYEGHDIDGEMDIFVVIGANYTDLGGLTSFDQIRLHPKRKEAEFFDTQSNVNVIANTDPWEGGLQAVRVDDGGYIVFEGRNLVNIDAVKYKVSATSAGGSIELRVGGPSGTLLATTEVPATGSPNNWAAVESPITDPGGKNDLYFVFNGSPGQQGIFDLNYVEFLGGGVSTDNSPPLVNAVTVIDNTTLHIEFSEALQEASAEALANYGIDNGISVLEAVLQPDGRTVALATSPLALGVNYNITVSNVENLSGLPVAAGSYPFTIPCTPTAGAFPADWTVHQLEETGFPYASVYTFPHHDLDGDGLKDIVTGGWWYKNPGTASGTWVRNDIDDPFNNVAFVHDFDGDGDMDLLGTQGTYPAGADLTWAENDGSGNFTIHTNIPSGATTYNEPFLAGIAPGIFQDGGPFQMAINWNGAEVNNSPVQLLTVPADPVNTAWTLENLSPDSLGEDIQAGDIDGDGDLDLFQGPNWLRNNGDGTWTTFLTGISYVTTPDRVQLADFDRDGDLDAVVGQLGLGSNPDKNEFSWFEAPADPTQAWTRHVLAEDITGSLSVFAVDMDFDGDLDIIVGEWQGDHELIAFENDLCGGGGTPWIRHTIDGGGPLEHHDGAQVTDIDNDGDLDIVSNGWLGNNIPRIFENGGNTMQNQAPVVTNPGPRSYNPGAVVSLQVEAEDPNAGDVLTYSAQGLPASLQISSTTGLISGTLEVALGEYPVTVRATDQGGLFDEESFVITVTDQALGIRINSGGPAYSFNGESWSADQYFSGGTPFTNNIAIDNTENDQLYQTERFTTSGTLTYQVPVENGTYNVDLHFAELYFGLPGGGSGGGEGSRVFNVDIENGQQTLTNYDIIAAAGAPATAVIEAFTDIEVTDGTLSITLSSVTENPKISGIEVFASGIPIADAGEDQEIIVPANSVVLPGSGTDPDGGSITAYAWTQQSGPNTAALSGADTAELTASGLVGGTYVFRLTVTDDEADTGFDEVSVTVLDEFATVRINSGGPAFTFNTEDWSADQHFTGGTIFTNAIAIANTENDQLYQTERYITSGNLVYEIPLAPGDYDLELHFAEIFHGVAGDGSDGGAGSRVFDISIENGQYTLEDYDIFVAAGGAATAVVESFPSISVGDGNLTITLIKGVDSPKLSGIAISGTSPLSANAGPDQNIILPDSDAVLNGSATGNVVSYQWTQESGPNTATLSGDTTPVLTAADLVEGSYVFRLTVTGDGGETDFDEATITVGPQPAAFRINSGGPTYAFMGDQWDADQYFSGGSSFLNTIPIANTENDKLYQSERYIASGTSLIYEIPVAAGEYELNLHFAEIYYGVPGDGSTGGAGSRVFNISIEDGQQVLNNYDIFVAAGGAATAVVESFNGILVNDGNLTITLTSVTEFPKISGIEVVLPAGETLLPLVDAGEDRNIVLPANSVVLSGTASDPDGGIITGYQWTQQSGPNTAALSGADTAELTAGGLVEGSYVFRLTATDDDGETAFDEVTVTVANQLPPTAVAEAAPTGGNAPLNVTFTGSNSTDDSSIVSYAWDFGDGGSSTEADPGYIFTEPGTYDVLLTVTDDGGLTDTDTVQITVNGFVDENPVAVAEATPDSGAAPLEVTFTGSNSTDDVGVVSYAWDFGDGGNSTEADPVYIFTSAGIYDVILTVTDGAGQTGTDTVTITVEAVPGSPVAVAEANPLSGNAPLEVTFTGSNSTDDVGIVSYAWDFGDGGSSTEADPVYTYATEGVYMAELTVTDGDGLTDTATVTITVSAVAGSPVAVAEANPLSGNAPLEVTFTGSNSTDDVGIVSYVWDFGDGGSSTDADPIYTYTADGVYVAELTVTDGDGLTDTATVTITVGEVINQPPVAVIAASVQSGNAPLEVSFTGSNSTDDAGIISYFWDFGDSFTSDLADPSHTFTTTGEYTVSLTVEDAEGLTDTATVTITVNEVGGDMIAILLENPAYEGVARVRILNQPGDMFVLGLYLHDYIGRFISQYNGQEIYNGGDWYEVPVSTLRDGLYFVTMIMNSGEPLPVKLLVKN